MQYLLTDDWENLEELVIYGFGKVAHDNIEFIKRNFNILYIVDSNKEKCGGKFKDINVKHLDEVKDDLINHKIVIMTANRNALLVGENLDKLELQNGKIDVIVTGKAVAEINIKKYDNIAIGNTTVGDEVAETKWKRLLFNGNFSYGMVLEI